MKLAIIGCPEHMRTDFEALIRSKMRDDVEIVFADTGTADKVIHISELETVIYKLQAPEIPNIVFQPEIKEKRKGWQRPYKYHR